jgi:hypothetical protein
MEWRGHWTKSETQGTNYMKKIVKFTAYGLVGLVLLSAGAALASPDKSAPPAPAPVANTATTKHKKPATTKQKQPVAVVKHKKPTTTAGQRNALNSAESYLETQAFSKTGLVKQLKFEGYSIADARWAARHVEVDWNAQAVKSARDYLDTQSFSREGLTQQLRFEGFTHAQAEHGVAVAYS